MARHCPVLISIVAAMPGAKGTSLPSIAIELRARRMVAGKPARVMAHGRTFDSR